MAFAGQNFCVPGCVPGPPGLVDFDPGKCWGRHDLACGAADDGGHVCLPNCNWDGNCGDGFGCIGTTGLCRGGGSGTVPVGSACTNDCLDNVCAEFASTGGETTRMCTAPCTIGVVPSCGWEGPGAGSAQEFCLFSSTTDAVAVGDLGFCGQLCDCNAQCANADFVCIPGTPAFTQATGRLGYCYFAEGSSGIQACTN
jgi:hypothetical protein